MMLPSGILLHLLVEYGKDQGAERLHDREQDQGESRIKPLFLLHLIISLS
jgi:hypothetical protein